MRAYFSIDYDEAPDTYRAVVVSPMREGQGIHPTKRFETGNPVEDWYQAMVYAASIYDLMICSSSVDHFTSDDPKYAWDEVDMLVRVDGREDT